MSTKFSSLHLEIFTACRLFRQCKVLLSGNFRMLLKLVEEVNKRALINRAIHMHNGGLRPPKPPSMSAVSCRVFFAITGVFSEDLQLAFALFFFIRKQRTSN